MKNKRLYPEYNINYISNCMSLRTPQKRSLKVLSEILNNVDLVKNPDLEKNLQTVNELFPTCSNFERDFFSLSFALATGVGKTRLMGAFITYLYTVKGIKNFFIVAPNITIYDKLRKEFSDINHDKYVFKGLSCFAGIQPNMVYGENYKNTGFMCGLSDCTINVFNIDKFNKQVGEMKKLSEFLGASYFKYLSELDDLVILMDESHHYRAEKGMLALNELNPVLGIELTATPQVEVGNKTVKFKNVVYEYPLSSAIKDGYTKIPYAMTRRDVGDLKFGDENLDKLMISDGILNHNRVKVALENYSNLNPTARKVKPFMLIVCKDTTHAEQVMKFITSDEFEDGYYKNKTIIIHSNQKGAEKEENIRLLNEVEKYENPIEIVIHVNILKEGWDVNNLYTIVPLRTAAAKTLREQTIGRGLRLPYGQRVNDSVVDSLVIAAHDKFNEIIEEANKPDSLLKAKNIIFAEEIKREQCVFAETKLDSSLQTRFEEVYNNFESSPNYTEEEKTVFKSAVSQIKDKLMYSYKFDNYQSSDKKISKEDIAKEIIESKDLSELANSRNDFSDIYSKFIVEEVERQYNIIHSFTMPIPIIGISAEGVSDYGFQPFELDVRFMNYVPISNDVLLKNLTSDEFLMWQVKGIDFNALNPMKTLAIELKSKPQISDKEDDLLFNLFTQFLNHLSKSFTEDEIKNIVMFNIKDIGNKIYDQMKKHYVKEDKDLVEQVVDVDLKPIPNSYIGEELSTKSLYDEIADRDVPKYIFTGFKRNMHEKCKFDSSPEKRLAIICENDNIVEKWMRPAPKQFKLFYNNNSRYEPDFVVETKDNMLLIEVKRDDMVDNEAVIMKRNRAVKYCEVANIYCSSHNMKLWKHLFIPASEIKITSSMDSLIKRYTWETIV